MFQDHRYEIIFPGSKIPEWFSHQCMGDEVTIMEPFSHLCNDWIGIAICLLFCPLPHKQFYNLPVSFSLIVNGKLKPLSLNIFNNMVALSNHIWLWYFLPQKFEKSIGGEAFIKSFWECDANGFREIGIKINYGPLSMVKKCGLRVVYKKDIEDLNCNVAQCRNNNIIPYEGLKESLNLWPMVNIVRSQVITRNVVKS